MGKDKALVHFLNRPLIQRVIERISPLADELLITTNHPKDYLFLGVPLFGDLLPGKGALGGLYTALSVAGSPLVGVIACDMPFVNKEILAHEIALIEQGPYAAVIPKSIGGYEPFHAIYRREICLPAIKKALDQQLHRVDSWFKEVNIYYLHYEEIRSFDPEQLAFININTPDEKVRAETIVLRTGDI